MKGLKIMKKLTIIIASLVALSIATVAQARDQIKIVGSSTVFPYATVVAERFGGSGFKTPVIESTGTGAVSYTHLTLPTTPYV